MKRDSKARISLDCSIEERDLIKALASLENMTISDYILSLAKGRMSEFAAWRADKQKKEVSKKRRGEDNFWDSIEGMA